MDLIEGEQRTFTRKLFYCCCLDPVSINDKLAFLGLQRLEMRRLYADLIMMYKLTHNIVFSSLTKVLHFTNDARIRGHRYKLYIKRFKKLLFKSFFIYRVVPARNSWPDECFECNSIQSFKYKLRHIDLSVFMKGSC